MTFIEWLQTALNRQGAVLDVDGDFGRATQAALRGYQHKIGIPVSGVSDPMTIEHLRADMADDAEAPVEILPPWGMELYRRMGLDEVRDNKELSLFLKIGRYLGNPANNPWCGDCIESAISKTLPVEPLPANPFFAMNWAKFGVDTKIPVIGSIGVIKWNSHSGHVTIVVRVDGDLIYCLGGNQGNKIKISAFRRENFIAFRWPSSYPFRIFRALQVKGQELSLATTR